MFEKFVAVIMLAVMLFIVPVTNMAKQQDRIIQADVSNTVSEFVDDVCKVGYVSQDMYNDFLSKLDSTSYLYDIELVNTHSTVYPVFDMDNTVIGTKSSDECYYKKEILDKVFNDASSGGKYTMHKDDTFSVTVNSKQKTLGTKVLELVSSKEISGGKIYYSYGNVIRNEKW